MADDATAKYFNPERLKRLRQLHHRYPLFCGRWPVEQDATTEARKTTRAWRLEHAIEELRQDETLWADSAWEGLGEDPLIWVNEEPTAQWPVVPEIIDKAPEEPVIQNAPEAVQLFLTCITYVTACWIPAGAGPLGPIAEHVEMAEPWEDALAGRLRIKLQRGNRAYYGIWDESQSVSGATLRHLAAQAERLKDAAARAQSDAKETARKEADKAVERLEKYWKKVGQEIGVFPVSRHGGKKYTITQELLDKLAEEARGVTREVRAYSPDEDRDSVRQSLMAEPFPAGPLAMSTAANNCAETAAKIAHFWWMTNR